MVALLKFILTLLLLSPYLILVGMTSYPQLALLFIIMNGLYGWVVIWFYANLKARDKLGLWGKLLFIPFLMVSGPLGLIIWLVFQPEVQRRNSQNSRPS